MTKNFFLWCIHLFMLVGLHLLAGCQAISTSQSLTPATLSGERSVLLNEPSPQVNAAGSSGLTASTTPDQPPTAELRSNSKANADVIFVEARLSGDGSWAFHVTVEHKDTGWEDYADGWDVVLPDGTVVRPDLDVPFTRLLLHPHENEQPFTRSQTGIVIPSGIETVRVRAHDLVDGFGGKEVEVDLSTDGGPNFKVYR